MDFVQTLDGLARWLGYLVLAVAVCGTVFYLVCRAWECFTEQTAFLIGYHDGREAAKRAAEKTGGGQ